MDKGLTESCGSCRYFRRMQIGQAGGVCRARPPVPMVIGQAKNNVSGEMFPMINTYWPQIPDSEWCGDFARRIIGVPIELTDPALEMEGKA